MTEHAGGNMDWLRDDLISIHTRDPIPPAIRPSRRPWPSGACDRGADDARRDEQTDDAWRIGAKRACGVVSSVSRRKMRDRRLLGQRSMCLTRRSASPARASARSQT